MIISFYCINLYLIIFALTFNIADSGYKSLQKFTGIINTNGAGDAFLAGVVHATMRGDSLDETAHTGLLAARAALLSPHAVNPELKQCMIRR